MSQLKKQSVAGKKNTRRVKPSTSKPATSTGRGLRPILSSTWRASTAFLAFIGKPCLSAAKKWPRATLALSVGCGLVIATGYGLNLVMQSITQSLPKTFEVNAPRPALQETITRIALDTLQSARAEEWSRTALTDKLLSRISLVEGVDEVSIRSGLDKRVKIDVAAQAPLLVIIGKNSERILVGNRYKVIARGVNASEYTHLPIVEAPELSLQVQQRERRRAHNGLFIKPSPISDSNIRWLSQQTMTISSLYTASKMNSELEKIVWKNVGGFSLVIKHPDEHPTASHSPNTVTAIPLNQPQQSPSAPLHAGPSKTTVILGEGQLNEKFERLAQVMQDLRLKKASVEQIDLAFSDKAIIRMSESLSETKRGGVQ